MKPRIELSPSWLCETTTSLNHSPSAPLQLSCLASPWLGSCSVSWYRDVHASLVVLVWGRDVDVTAMLARPQACVASSSDFPVWGRWAINKHTHDRVPRPRADRNWIRLLFPHVGVHDLTFVPCLELARVVMGLTRRAASLVLGLAVIIHACGALEVEVNVLISS